MERVRAGETEAFGILVRRYQGTLYRFLLRLLRSPQDAEDLAQEVFLQCYRQLPSLRDPTVFRAWLLRIAHARAIDHVRASRAARRQAPVPAMGEMDPETVPSRDAGTDPEKVAAQRERVRVLGEALADLPPAYRAVIHLRYVEGLGVKEIGSALGLGVRTVDTRLYRGKRLLREILERRGWHVEG